MAPTLLKNPDLDFKGTYSASTGMVNDDKLTAKFNGLTFNVHNTGYCTLEGSLHKFANGGVHNHNDLPYSKVCEVLEGFQDQFKIKPEKTRLRVIEFGINARPPIPTEALLNDVLIHKNDRFRDGIVPHGYYRQAEQTQYIIKAYDKGCQYHLGYELFRFELKFKKMAIINSCGVYTLNDLLNAKWINPVGWLLVKAWDGIILFENPKDFAELPHNIKSKKLQQWSNPRYWLELAKQERHRQKGMFHEYVVKHTHNYKEVVSNIIQKKWGELAHN